MFVLGYYMMHMYIHIYSHAVVDPQRSENSVWVLGFKLRLLGLAASAFTHLDSVWFFTFFFFSLYHAVYLQTPS